MANTERARKLMVRSALVTTTTIATLVGAQNFAMIDTRTFQPETPNFSLESNDVVMLASDSTHTPVSVVRSAPNITILRVAPSITILRQSGQMSTSPRASASVTSIQPPAPAHITAPDPVVVQQPVPQRSRSSR